MKLSKDGGIRPSLGFHTKLKTFFGRFWLFLGFWTSTSTIKNPVTHFIYLYIICLWVLFWQSNIQWHLDPGRTWGTMSRGLPQAVSWLVECPLASLTNEIPRRGEAPFLEICTLRISKGPGPVVLYFCTHDDITIQQVLEYNENILGKKGTRWFWGL